MNTRPGAASSTTAARAALAIALGALAAMLPACGSTNTAPVRQRDLVVANPVSVSPGLANATPSRAQADPEHPRRRPGAIVRAPRPGDDLSAPPKKQASASTPPASTAQRAADNQIQSTIKVASAEQPKASPPPQPKPDPEPAVNPTPQPTPQPATSFEWWKVSPASTPGRIRIVASGVGSNLREAREAAVESGLAKLRASLGADPREVTYERTTVQPEGSGVLRGFVLVSCKDAP